MNREKLQTLASEWVRTAKNDIRSKVLAFINEVHTTKDELAYALSISNGEMEQIINGNGEISLTTLAKLLIATGNALEIKPIGMTPMRSFDNIPNEVEDDNMEEEPSLFEDRMPFHRHDFEPSMSRRSNDRFEDEPIIRPQERHMPPPPSQEFLERMFGNMPPRQSERFGRPMNARQEEMRSERPQAPISPFASMPREQLVRIIKNHLWDSEIDTRTAPNDVLVDFLNEKDKKMREVHSQGRESRSESLDPKVAEFKEKLKQFVHTNPNLRDMFSEVIESE